MSADSYAKYLGLKYANLPEFWLDANSIGGDAHITSPENIQAFQNVQADPFALYNRPLDTTPPWSIGDYPSVGVNYSPNVWRDGQYIITSGEDSPLYGKKNIFDPNAPTLEGYMAHENAHGQDPRLNASRPGSFPNRGWTTLNGDSTTDYLWAREFPAILAELEQRGVRF